MRILHTSDWHLGIQLHGVSLLEEQRNAALFLAETVEKEKIEAVVIAGDIFDHAVPPPDAVRLYSHMMRTLCIDRGVPVLLCAGNHDGAARLSVCAPLLRDAGLFVAGSLSDGVEPVVLGDTAFFLLPYFNAEEARYLYPDREIRGAADAMAVVCEDLRTRLAAGKRNVLVSHCFAAGGETGESDRAAVLGSAGRIPLTAFAGFDYVALGHLHRAQQLACGDTILRYSGTPYPYSFGEAGQEKSFTLLDTQTMDLSTIPVPPSRPLRILRGEQAALLENAPWDKAREDYLKIELTDSPPHLWLMAAFREYYPNLLEFQGLRQSGEGQGITVQELEELRPLDLVTKFCEEVGGYTPDEDLLKIFREEALGSGEEERQ